jgi:hypothetical protein
MKFLDIEPSNLNTELALRICKNKALKKEYINKYFNNIHTWNYLGKKTGGRGEGGGVLN